MRHILAAAACLALVSPAAAQDQRVQFAPGTTGATLSDSLPSGGAVRYLLGAGGGQYLAVDLAPGNASTNFILYTPTDDILAESTQTGMSYYGQLSQSGDHVVEVFNNGDTTATHTVTMQIFNEDTMGADDGGGAMDGAQPAQMPSELEQRCLQAVSVETGNGDVVLLGSEFSEAATAVYIGVGPQQARWRCLISSDGTVGEVMSMVDEGSL